MLRTPTRSAPPCERAPTTTGPRCSSATEPGPTGSWWPRAGAGPRSSTALRSRPAAPRRRPARQRARPPLLAHGRRPQRPGRRRHQRHLPGRAARPAHRPHRLPGPRHLHRSGPAARHRRPRHPRRSGPRRRHPRLRGRPRRRRAPDRRPRPHRRRPVRPHLHLGIDRPPQGRPLHPGTHRPHRRPRRHHHRARRRRRHLRTAPLLPRRLALHRLGRRRARRHPDRDPGQVLHLADGRRPPPVRRHRHDLHRQGPQLHPHRARVTHRRRPSAPARHRQRGLRTRHQGLRPPLRLPGP